MTSECLHLPRDPSGAYAEIEEGEVLGHAVVKLSHELLLVKENKVPQEVEHAVAGHGAGRR